MKRFFSIAICAVLCLTGCSLPTAPTGSATLNSRKKEEVHGNLQITTLKENYDVGDNDEVMAFLQNFVIDGDGFLRLRISERFNGIIKGLFDAYRKAGLPPEQAMGERFTHQSVVELQNINSIVGQRESVNLYAPVLEVVGHTE